LNCSWGKTSKERQSSVGDAVNELTIIREQLKHANVVRYYKTFILGKQLRMRTACPPSFVYVFNYLSVQTY